MDRFEAPWLVIENAVQPGELVTIQAGTEKYALVFTDPVKAGVFLAELADDALQLGTLESWVLKDTYLTAAERLSCSRVAFDYARGEHNVPSAPLAGLRDLVRSRIGAANVRVADA